MYRTRPGQDTEWHNKYTDPAYCFKCQKPDVDKDGYLKRVRKDNAWFCSDCDPEGWLDISIHGSQIPLLLKVINQYFRDVEKEEDYKEWQQVEDIATTLHSIVEEQKRRKRTTEEVETETDQGELPF